MSSNKSWKTILYTIKLEKITIRLNLRIKLKIYLFKPKKDPLLEQFLFRLWVKSYFMLKYSSICIVKPEVHKCYENSLSKTLSQQVAAFPKFCKGLSQTVAFPFFSF